MTTGMNDEWEFHTSLYVEVESDRFFDHIPVSTDEKDNEENLPTSLFSRSFDKVEAASHVDFTSDKKREVIELAKLPPEMQLEIEHIRELQGMIIQLAPKLKFSNNQEKEIFLEKLRKELGEPVEGQPGKYHKLPEFSETTREGFQRVSDFFAKGHLPDLLGALDKQLLEIPPGFPLKIAGKQEDILKSSEQFRQELQQGKGYLDIDLTRLEDVRKLYRVIDWVSSAEKSLHANYVERLERYLALTVEEGIKTGKFPPGWRRSENLDKETWCSAVEQSMNAYTRMTRVIEAIDYLNKSGTGFNCNALDKLPPGVKISRDRSGKIIDIEFGSHMIQDLRLQSDANRQKLDPLMLWCDIYETKAQQALGEAFKERNHVAGFGQYEVAGGWINPKTKEFVVGTDQQPGSDWQKFGLFSYDMEIKQECDAFSKVRKIYVSSDVAFQEVPPYGYLNTFARDVHRTKSDKPVEYQPDDYVAVQTGPGRIEMIKAKDLSNWKTRQQIEHYGNKAITLTMDGAMVVSGLGELRAAAKVAQLGAKEALKIGGQILKTEVAEQLPKGIAAGMVRKGLFEIGLGVTGVFHNAGAHEVPWMKAVSDVRTLYFLGHASYSVTELFRITKVARALSEVLTPGLVKAADKAITSIRGTEDLIRASQVAKAGALENLPLWRGVDSTAHVAFNVSERAFIGMFMWQAVGISQRFADPYRAKALEQARKDLDKANQRDSSALEQAIQAANKPSAQAENYMRRYMETLPGLEGPAKKEAAEIIARVKELSKPGTKGEDKQKYIQELMKYLRYDGKTISSLQDSKFTQSQLSDTRLNEKAQVDREKLDTNLRKMAALAILTLGRKPDGSWTEEIACRKVTVPEFTELIQIGDEVITSRKGPLEIEQKVTAEELVKLLRADLQEQNDENVRTEKAAALHENGLVSGEQMGDLLLTRIEGKLNVTSKEERNRAIADLAGLISRLKVEEKLREEQFNRAETFTAKGLTAGLNSTELIKRLEKAAVEANDHDVKATALLSLTLLKKENLDNTDRDRIRDFFLKDPPGISTVELLKLLEKDAASKPTGKAGWERKMIAAEALVLISMVPDASKIDQTAVGYLQQCLAESNQPEVAARALQALMKSDQLGGSPLSALEQVDPEGNWRRKFVVAALNNLDLPAGVLEPGKQLEAAKARIKVIEAASTLLQGPWNDEQFRRLMKGQFAARLLARADIQSEPVEEVRAAAVKAIGALGIRARMQIEILKKAVDAQAEPSPAVRLAAVDAIERLIPRNKERREILRPLAVQEPDLAVKERMARYYDPTGSIRDRNAQRSRQDVADAKVEQNKEEFKPADIDKMVAQRYKKLAGSESIFDYINANDELFKTWGYGNQHLAALWDSAIDTINSWHQDYVKDGARRNLIEFELFAQNRAVIAFNKGVDDLAEAAMKPGVGTVPVGDKTIPEKDAAILALGSLVRNGSRMGPAFYKHRDTYDRQTSTPGLRDFNSEEQRRRDDVAANSNQDLKVYDEATNLWPVAELRIAEKMRDLCSQSSKDVNLSLLKEEMLRALRSDSKTTDESRKILVEGLDRLLSNPGTAPEAKREILKAVGEIVKTSREVQKDKQEATIAMIALMDKNGKASFETYSDAYSSMRTAVVSRSENDQMPPHLRLRAQEMFDRQWVSVLAEADRIPARQGTARTLAEFLPKNFESLEKAKEGKTDGYDEDVHDGVQRIIEATKGLPVEAQDPRRSTLEELTKFKYDDRVRMAAVLALAPSNGMLPVTLLSTLKDLALNSRERAIRNDAALYLQKAGPPECISVGELENPGGTAGSHGRKVEYFAEPSFYGDDWLKSPAACCYATMKENFLNTADESFNGKLEELKNAMAQARERLSDNDFEKFVRLVQSGTQGRFQPAIEGSLLKGVVLDGQNIFRDNWKAEPAWREHDRIIQQFFNADRSQFNGKFEELKDAFAQARERLSDNDFEKFVRLVQSGTHGRFQPAIEGRLLKGVVLDGQNIFRDNWKAEPAWREHDRIIQQFFNADRSQFNGKFEELKDAFAQARERLSDNDFEKFVRLVQSGTDRQFQLKWDVVMKISLQRTGSPFDGQTIYPRDARALAKELERKEALHRSGEGLALVGTMLLKNTENRPEAERLLRISLSDFGVTNDDLDRLCAEVQSHDYEHVQLKTVRAIADKLAVSLQTTGAVPGLLTALNGYARLCCSRFDNNADAESANKRNLSCGIALTLLAERMAELYYPEGSIGRADQYRNIALFYEQTGSNLNHRKYWYNNSSRFMYRAYDEIERCQQLDKDSKTEMKSTLGKEITKLQTDRIEFVLKALETMVADRDPDSMRAFNISCHLDELLTQVKDRNGAKYKTLRFRKDWLDLSPIVPCKKEADAKIKAEAALETSLKSTAHEFGSASFQYEVMLKRMWEFHMTQKQPEKVEQFFQEGLSKTTNPDQAETRKVLLRQYANFLRTLKNETRLPVQ